MREIPMYAKRFRAAGFHVALQLGQWVWEGCIEAQRAFSYYMGQRTSCRFGANRGIVSDVGLHDLRPSQLSGG